MTSRILFIVGALLALIALACSLAQQPLLSVLGASLDLIAVLCGVGIIYLNRVHRTAPLLQSRRYLLIASIALILIAVANLFSFRYPAWHTYLQPLMMFILAVQVLVNGASFRDSATA